MIKAQNQNLSAKAEAILTGAMTEFLAHGYAATSMDRVAAAAGVSKATVYSHFGDKEGLFNALIQRLAAKFQTILGLQEPQSLPENPEIFLKQLLNRMLDNAVNDRAFQNFMRIIIGESGRFPEIAQAYANNIAKPGLGILAQRLQSYPQLNLSDSEATARVIVGTLVYYVLLQEMLHGQEIVPFQSDRLVDTLTNLITTQEKQH